MPKIPKLLDQLRRSPHAVRFADFVSVIEAHGFLLKRVRGSHHIFRRPGMAEMLNVQSESGRAKSYQVGQFLAIINQYGIEIED